VRTTRSEIEKEARNYIIIIGSSSNAASVSLGGAMARSNFGFPRSLEREAALVRWVVPRADCTALNSELENGPGDGGLYLEV